jgi:hypothetical protein
MKYKDFTPKDLKWIDEFQKVMKKAPPYLFIFVGSKNMVVYPQRYMTDIGGVDGNAPNRSVIANCEVDGGDW